MNERNGGTIHPKKGNQPCCSSRARTIFPELAGQVYNIVVTVLVTVKHPVITLIELVEGLVVMEAAELLGLLNPCEDPPLVDSLYSDRP
jgi:hypothetical protein